MDEQDGVSLIPLQQVVESLLIVIDVGIAADVPRRHRQLAARSSNLSIAMLAKPRPLEMMASRSP